MQAPESTSTVAMQAPESTSVSAPAATSAVTDTAAALVALPADSSVSPRIDRAVARIRAHELIRMRSVFGEFQGFAAAVGPRGLAGLSRDLHRHPKFHDAAPSGLVWWEQIDYVEKKETSFAKGALEGGAGMFATAGLLGIMLGTFALAAGGDVDPTHVGLVWGSVAGGIGAVLGGMVGGSVPSWRKAYERP